MKNGTSLHIKLVRRIVLLQEFELRGVLPVEREHRRSGGRAGPLHHRESDHGPRRRAEIRHQQVHAAAKHFGLSKSTVHKDLSERLPTFNKPLYLQVKGVLEENKAERHIRGGIATRKKYKGE